MQKEIKILKFPEWNTIPYDVNSPDTDIQITKMQTIFDLMNLDKNKKTLLLISKNSLVQKIINKKDYRFLDISIDDKYSIQDIENILSLNKDLMNWINETTPLLQNSFYTIDTKLYWIFNDLHDFPCCDFCKKAYIDRNVFTIARGYPEFCSHICVVNSPKTKEKTR